MVDPELSSIARCGRGTAKNVSRQLHAFIHRSGRTFPATVDVVPTPIKILRGKPKVVTSNFPVIFLSSWAQELFKLGGQPLLGGHLLHEESSWRNMFKSFWERFRFLRADLDIYNRADFDVECCVPFGLHGDEGRGRLRRPILIISFQPMISHKGPSHTNSSGTLALHLSM